MLRIVRHHETADQRVAAEPQDCWGPSDAGCGTYLLAPWTWIVRALRKCRRVYATFKRTVTDPAPTKAAVAIELNQERLAHEYSRGYLAGWRECFEQCLEAVEDEIARTDEIWRMGAALTSSKEIQRKN